MKNRSYERKNNIKNQWEDKNMLASSDSSILDNPYLYKNCSKTGLH